MSVVGQWKLYFIYPDMGETQYSEYTFDFKIDDTFTSNKPGTKQFESGKWVQVNGMIMFWYPQDGARFAGNIAGKVMAGFCAIVMAASGPRP